MPAAEARPSCRLKTQVPPTSLVLVACSLIQLTGGLKFDSVQIPALVQRGANFWLACQFELAPSEQLYGVKWYKDNQEFYRLQAAEAADSQQQYFGQAGVNVMMSWSNATHVRLLNASIESEGAYACEISTQNLSTIRYEREIRLFVLAHSRPSIIGLRSRYAPGDMVDLQCSSDFSRPKAALAWFINGKRIAQSDELFELEHRAQSKLGLSRSNLSLKFKLVAGLWRMPSDSSKLQPPDWPNQGNQSHSSRQQRRRLSTDQLAYQLPEQLQPLRLQCRYKLTEISDVTFNELLLRPASTSSSLQPEDETGDGRLVSGRRWTAGQQQWVSLAKLADNRLSQAPSPAPRNQLRRALLSGGSTAGCQLGALALQPDDPLLVVADSWEEEKDELGTQEVARSVGQTLSVNCSTIGALVSSSDGSEAADLVSVDPWRPAQAPARVAFCDNAAQRRRSAISGRVANNEELDSGGGRRNNNRRRIALPAGRERPLLAYLSLGGPQPANQQQSAPQQQQQQQHEESAELAEFSPTTNSADSTAQDSWWAPPLLEWFINNQEAPHPTTDGASQSAPIDYTQYFANFDAKQAAQQHLPLALTLDKRHFMTPDSNLRLRCSSTQAQVLAADAISLVIVPLAPGEQAPFQHQSPQRGGTAHRLHYQTRRPHQARSSGGQLTAGASSAASDPRSLVCPFRLMVAAVTLLSLLVSKETVMHF